MLAMSGKSHANENVSITEERAGWFVVRVNGVVVYQGSSESGATSKYYSYNPR